MAFARDTYVASSSQTDFTISFASLDDVDISVFKDGVLMTNQADADIVSYQIITSSIVRFGAGLTSGDVVVIQRKTSQSVRLVDYQTASTLTEEDLDTDSLQAFFMAQEAIDEVVLGLGRGTDDNWDALNLLMKNLGTPNDPADAATKAYIDAIGVTAGNVPTPANPADDGKVVVANGGTFSFGEALEAGIADGAVTGGKIALASEAEGDIMYRNATEWVRLAKGTALQTLQTNSGATAPEWFTPLNVKDQDLRDALNQQFGSADDVQTFTADGTWTKDGSATADGVMLVVVKGAGGGGGSGAEDDTTSALDGGGGGGAGGCTLIYVLRTGDAAATEAVIVGSGGAGGAESPTNSAGLIGVQGEGSWFGLAAYASGGAPGPGGGSNVFGGNTVDANTADDPPLFYWPREGIIILSNTGGNGGRGTDNSTKDNTDAGGHRNTYSAGGGGGGGRAVFSFPGSSGGDGGHRTADPTDHTGGSALGGSSDAADGGNGAVQLTFQSKGAGGGAAGSSNGGDGGIGTDGGGGGGGGGCRNGGTGGLGGAGGRGQVWVYTWF